MPFLRRKTRPLARRLADYALTLLLIGAALWALRSWGGFDGTAVRVVDGDSLYIGQKRVRLSGIDAVELHQTCLDPKGRPWPCGKLARNHLRTLLRGARLHCAPVDVDRFGRTVAICRANGKDIGRSMIAAGWAIAFIGAPPSYLHAQRTARKARRGIWHGRFTPPARWRARARALHGSASGTAHSVPPD